MGNRPWIELRRPVLGESGKIVFELRTSRALRHVFHRRSWYLKGDFDVGSIPEAVLSIPAVATLAPIAWATDSVLHVPVLDATFSRCLERVRQGFRVPHPEVNWAGEVAVEELRELAPPEGRADRSAVLWSGGVDSWATLIDHLDERPDLVTISGVDVGLRHREVWRETLARHKETTAELGLELHVLESDFRTFFDSFLLGRRYTPILDSWYSSVQISMGTLGLCAPLAWSQPIGTLVHASGWGGPHAPPSGTTTIPEVEDAIRWTGCRVVHDGFESTRADKIARLAQYVRQAQRPLPLRVCWGKAHNCTTCGKCRITITNLALENLDPRDFGFDIGGDFFADLQRDFENGRAALAGFSTSHWLTLQQRTRLLTRPALPESQAFFDWFVGFDITQTLRAASRFSLRRLRKILALQPGRRGRLVRRTLGHPFP